MKLKFSDLDKIVFDKVIRSLRKMRVFNNNVFI